MAAYFIKAISENALAPQSRAAFGTVMEVRAQFFSAGPSGISEVSLLRGVSALDSWRLSAIAR